MPAPALARASGLGRPAAGSREALPAQPKEEPVYIGIGTVVLIVIVVIIILALRR
jgi:hypothetical protein